MSIQSTSQKNWDLPTAIIARSEAKEWGQAINEWNLTSIELLSPGEESETCLCGHNPIREVCHITNEKTQATAIVGNHCIKKFSKELSSSIMSSVPRITSAVKKILRDFSKSATPKLLDYAKEKEILSNQEHSFYQYITRRKNLSPREESLKRFLNEKILYAMSTSFREEHSISFLEHQAFYSIESSLARLQEDLTEGVSLYLIAQAKIKNVFRDKDCAFYTNTWHKDSTELTDKQINYRIWLNQKLLNLPFTTNS